MKNRTALRAAALFALIPLIAAGCSLSVSTADETDGNADSADVFVQLTDGAGSDTEEPLPKDTPSDTTESGSEAVTAAKTESDTYGENEKNTEIETEAESETVAENSCRSEPVYVGATDKGFEIYDIDGRTYIDGVLIVNKSYPLPSDYDPGGLDDEMKEAFSKMQSAAADDGISLFICSGYRSYSTQTWLYRNYVDRDGQRLADTYSARPGYSEHQSGLAADINSIYLSFAQTPEGKWLAEHCREYGFIIRYPEGKSDITGYMYEPWHIRFVGTELAEKLYDSGLTLEEYFGIDSVYAE